MKNQEEPENSVHWSRQKEQAAGYWHVKFLLILFRLLPVIVLRVLAFPVGFFYFVFSKKGRKESRRFLEMAAPLVDANETAKKCRSPLGPLRHIVSFSLTLVEKLQSWGGKFPFRNIHFQDDDDAGELIRDLENERGVFLVTSHLGNMELLRGLVSFDKTGVSRKIPVTAVIDTKITAHFSRVLKELNPHSAVDLVSAEEMGPQSAVLFAEKLAAGGIVTIAGDRTSVTGSEKNLLVPFLGREAPFSPGAFYLAAMLKAPVYFIFAMRRGALSLRPEYDMHIHKKEIPHESSRKERFRNGSDLACSFASLLESYCKKHPFQWYNFYDFWSKGV